MKKLALLAAAFLNIVSLVGALAQGNPTCPTRPAGDSTNACASTAFVQGAVVSTGVSSLNGQTGALILWTPPQGRVTLATNTPVMLASYAAQTTVYYTSTQAGKNVPIYNGTQIAQYQICATNTVGACELSITLGANFTANSIFDGYIGLNSGTVTFCASPAWASDTTRGTGAGTAEVESFDGLLTNKFSMTCRYANASTFTCAAHQCTKVGSFRTGNAGQVNFIYGAGSSGGTAANFGVFNDYNPAYIVTQVTDTGISYTYSSATVRQARASAGNQVSFLIGAANNGLTASIGEQLTTIAAAGAFLRAGMAFDSTTTFNPKGVLAYTSPAVVASVSISLTGVYAPSIGYHTIARNEQGDGTNANSFDSDNLAFLSMGLWL